MATRSERVVLSLEDNFTTPMARAAAATAVLSKNLHGLDDSTVKTGRNMRTASGDVDVFTKSNRSAGAEVDRLSGRLGIIRDAALTLGPALVPLGAAGAGAIAGLAAQLGAAAGATGVAIMAFNGIGDALGAVNEYALEPTEANLEKLNDELTKIGPAGADFVTFLSSIRPQLLAIQDTARAGLLPGVQEGIESLLVMGPQVERIVINIAAAMGEMSANAGEALASDRYADFFNYIENTAGPTLMQMGRTLGNVTEGLANMMVAFTPISSQFSGGLEEMTASFARWSRGLEDNAAFSEFIDYLRINGPAAVDFLGSMVRAVAGLVEAAAPIGQAVLPALTRLLDVFAAISGTKIGTAVLTAAAAFVALNRATSVLGPVAKSLADRLYLTSDSLAKVGTSADTAGRGLAGLKFAGVLAGLLLVNQALSELGTNLDNADLGRNLEAFAAGSQVEDFEKVGRYIEAVSSAQQAATEGFEEAGSLFGLLGDTQLDKAQAQVEALDQALAGLVESGSADQAAEAFERLMEAAVANGVDPDEAARQFDAYATALGNASAAADDAAGSTAALGTAEAAQARATREAVAALRAKRDATLAAFDAETAYRQALKDATAQAKTNTAGIRGNSDAALANRGALSQLAAAWNDQSAAVRNNNQKFREARAAFIETAESMGVTRQRARELANEILAIPKSREIKIVAHTEDAMAQLYRIQQYQLDDKIVRVHTVRTSSDGVGFVSGGRSIPASADGCTVPTDRPAALPAALTGATA